MKADSEKIDRLLKTAKGQIEGIQKMVASKFTCNWQRDYKIPRRLLARVFTFGGAFFTKSFICSRIFYC